jgi:hypothetical protein
VTEGVTELSRSLTGTVIGPEDAEYDAARRCFSSVSSPVVALVISHAGLLSSPSPRTTMVAWECSVQECGDSIGCGGDERRVVVEIDLALRLKPQLGLGDLTAE